MDIATLNRYFFEFKSKRLSGRYITNAHIEKCFNAYPESVRSIIGYSVENRPIYAFCFGHGSTKILLWSQMHGNESTTTKALFDCFNFFLDSNPDSRLILRSCSFYIVPILNPDGAEIYTRFNANKIDLNRDAQNLSQPESKALRQVYDSFRPDYCFNLHGQRTIFGAGSSGNVASLSFLAPSQDAQRSLSKNRKVAMALIATINDALQKDIKFSVGRYEDGFNSNCVGDTFQSLGTPTVLYEAGHFSGDYQREVVRRLVFVALLKGFESIAKGIDTKSYKNYDLIPENAKCFYDVLIRNTQISKDAQRLCDIGIQFKEVLNAGTINFIPKVEQIGSLNGFFGHYEIDARGALVESLEKLPLEVGTEIDFVLMNSQKKALKP